MKLFDFHDFYYSRVEFYNFHDCLYFLMIFQDFHDFRDSQMNSKISMSCVMLASNSMISIFCYDAQVKFNDFQYLRDSLNNFKIFLDFCNYQIEF